MSEKLKIVFFPADAAGHMNACIGLGSVLRDRGHTVTFIVSTKWKGKLSAQGFGEEFYTQPGDLEDQKAAGEKWGDMITEMAPVFSLPPIEIHEAFYVKMLSTVSKIVYFANDQAKIIIKRLQPDLIIVDVLQQIPAVMNSGIPWILSVSVTPLGISRENVPPPFAGYPTEGDRTEWNIWEDRIAKIYEKLGNEFNNWLVSEGSQPVVHQFPFMLRFSPYANIYMYPTELDYTTYRPNPPNFYHFEAFVRQSTETFEIPTKIKTGPGKLIYFSMGTIGCAELGLMRRLIGILAKSPNRFIVSKGHRGDDLDLAENMWGDKYVPQVAVIPQVDLVITHGGNNTITESFYFGKRVLVLPMLYDQLDNGQRIHETGLGLSFHPYKVSEDELLVAIETLLGDELLQRRMTAISKRIQASNSQSRAAELVEKVARKHCKFSVL